MRLDVFPPITYNLYTLQKGLLINKKNIMSQPNGINPTLQEINLAPTTVITQITSAVTGVIANTASGQITTVTQNIAAGGEITFIVTNGVINTNSIPFVSIASGSVGGTPIAFVSAVSAGSFSITVSNLHATVAETGVLVINFGVIGV